MAPQEQKQDQIDVVVNRPHNAFVNNGISLVNLAGTELEKLKETDDERAGYHAFPPACLALLKTLSGNNRCIDCAGFEPEWASIRFGAMLCLQCSGRHRKLGVNISPVRSTTLDSWTLVEILSMLEGGNTQLKQFFHRHKLCENNNNSNSNSNNNNKHRTKKQLIITKENVTEMRYRTKAAQFYREKLSLHVQTVRNHGVYQGREVSRKLHHRSQNN